MNMPLIDRGVRVSNALLTFVREDETIRCLRDHIVVEPLDIDHGTMLELVYRGQPVRGRVLAVGPGHYQKKYNGPKGKRTKSWDSKHFTPCDVRIGDLVDLGGLEINGYLFTRLIWGSRDCVICREADIALIVEEPDWIDANGKKHRYKCGLNPDPYAIKHMVKFCTCPK